MKYTIAILGLGCLLALSACDSKKPTAPDNAAIKADKPAAPAKTDKPVEADKPVEPVEAAEPDTPVEAAKPDTPAAPPMTEEEKAKQCAAILDKSFKAIAPGYAKAGIEVTPELEKYYLRNAKGFIKGCTTKASRAYRDCLEASAVPTEGIQTCRSASGEDENRLDLVSMVAPEDTAKFSVTVPSHVTTRPAVDPAAFKATLAKLVGTWKQTNGSQETTWTIGADGGVTEVTVRKGGEPKEKTFKLLAGTDTALDLQYENNNQTRGFAMLSNNTFVIQGNLMWMPSYMGDGTKFVVRSGFDAVLYDNGKCEALTSAGSLLPATCTFSEKDGQRLFDVTYQIPGKTKWKSTDPNPEVDSFGVFGEYLVVTRLLRTPFTRQ